MTKNKIIKGLIRGYGCDDEDDCILSCNDCIHQKFLDYEKQIRADAIDEFKNYLLKHKKLVREFETDYVYESVKIEFITDTGAE